MRLGGGRRWPVLRDSRRGDRPGRGSSHALASLESARPWPALSVLSIKGSPRFAPEPTSSAIALIALAHVRQALGFGAGLTASSSSRLAPRGGAKHPRRFRSTRSDGLAASRVANEQTSPSTVPQPSAVT